MEEYVTDKKDIEGILLEQAQRISEIANLLLSMQKEQAQLGERLMEISCNAVALERALRGKNLVSRQEVEIAWKAYMTELVKEGMPAGVIKWLKI